MLERGLSRHFLKYKGGEMVRKLKKALLTDNEKRISREEFMQLVQTKAYEIYEKRGCQPGNDLEDWLNAERLVKEDLGIK
jgi:hypothetical protein